MGALDKIQPFADALEGIQYAIQLFIGVSGHVAGSQERLVGRHCGWHYRIDVHAFLEECLPKLEGLYIFPNEYRDYGCLTITCVIAHLGEPLAHLGTDLPHSLYSFWFLLHHLQSGQYGSSASWWHAGTEDK